MKSRTMVFLTQCYTWGETEMHEQHHRRNMEAKPTIYAPNGPRKKGMDFFECLM